MKIYDIADRESNERSDRIALNLREATGLPWHARPYRMDLPLDLKGEFPAASVYVQQFTMTVVRVGEARWRWARAKLHPVGHKTHDEWSPNWEFDTARECAKSVLKMTFEYLGEREGAISGALEMLQPAMKQMGVD